MLKQKHGGFFLDIGAGDGVEISNTLRLERDFGWHGIAIEPSRQFEVGLASIIPSLYAARDTLLGVRRASLVCLSRFLPSDDATNRRGGLGISPWWEPIT